MAKPSAFLQIYARMGAQARIAELKAEIAAIERAFPDLTQRRPGRPRDIASAAAGARNRKRKRMTAAQRKAVGKRMKKYWAAKRKAANKS